MSRDLCNADIAGCRAHLWDDLHRDLAAGRAEPGLLLDDYRGHHSHGRHPAHQRLTYTYTYTYTHSNAYPNSYTHAYTYPNAYLDTQAHTHTHTYTYTYTYADFDT